MDSWWPLAWSQAGQLRGAPLIACAAAGRGWPVDDGHDIQLKESLRMTSSARQTFEKHVAAVGDRDLDAIVASYAPDAVLVDSNRIGRGHDYIRAVHAEVLDAAADLQPSLDVFEDGDVVFVSWRPPLLTGRSWSARTPSSSPMASSR